MECAQIFVNEMQVAWAQKLKEVAVYLGRLLTCCRYLEVQRNYLNICCMQLSPQFPLGVLSKLLSLGKNSVLVIYSSKKFSLDILKYLNFS